MEIVFGIVFVLGLIIFIGKLKGSPTPKEMSDEAINGQLQLVANWISKFNALPIEHRKGLSEQHDKKSQYSLELILELNNRHGKKEESLAPALQRTFELVRSGVPEEQAREQAIAEYVTARDARQFAAKANGEVSV